MPSILSTATSLSGSKPTTLARHVDWSSSVTCTSDAPLITWKLVTMWPSLSHTNPEPVPTGTRSALRDMRGSFVTLRRLVMLTTLGVFCWKMRMLLVSSTSRPAGSSGAAMVMDCSTLAARTALLAAALVTTMPPVLASTCCIASARAGGAESGMPSGAAKLLRLITAASASTPARDVADGSSLPSAQSPTWSVARASGSPLRSRR
mmetsp:Transcript_41480/g.123943  ORF Transcript_41480/g.123943 Transcript_41480/m.123943 type:complete len:206 (-) Transcript_41480:446-1063(-)